MSDTKRNNHVYPKRTLRTWASLGVNLYRNLEQQARERRDEKLTEKGADGHNEKGPRAYWRYEGAKRDGSGKMDLYTETGSKRRGNRNTKRRASKDTRRIGKQIIKKELD
jgi:hypothetical protein